MGHGQFSGADGQDKTEQIRLLRILQRLWRLPSFFSFLGNHDRATDKTSYANYNKYNAYWQGKVLEEIAGKPYADDIFAVGFLPGGFLYSLSNVNCSRIRALLFSFLCGSNPFAFLFFRAHGRFGSLDVFGCCWNRRRYVYG